MLNYIKKKNLVKTFKKNYIYYFTLLISALKRPTQIFRDFHDPQKKERKKREEKAVIVLNRPI